MLLSKLAIDTSYHRRRNILLPQEERLIITMPPLYKKWFQSKYPSAKWEESPSGKYVLELLNGLQGDKSIGRKW
jgi:hypothetical protein